jgi:hypothetical protein
VSELDIVPFFAYGAKMRRAAMLEAGIRPERRERAQLDAWALTFDLPGIPVVEPAFASIAPREGSTVHGVVWWITRAEARRLNKFESSQYEVIEVDVALRESSTIRARAYRNPRPVAGLVPSRRYLRLLAEGAREAELPEEYARALEEMKGAYIPIVSELSNAMWRLFIATRGR